jgi:hypothetical protein
MNLLPPGQILRLDPTHTSSLTAQPAVSVRLSGMAKAMLGGHRSQLTDQWSLRDCNVACRVVEPWGHDNLIPDKTFSAGWLHAGHREKWGNIFLLYVQLVRAQVIPMRSSCVVMSAAYIREPSAFHATVSYPLTLPLCSRS